MLFRLTGKLHMHFGGPGDTNPSRGKFGTFILLGFGWPAVDRREALLRQGLDFAGSARMIAAPDRD